MRLLHKTVNKTPAFFKRVPQTCSNHEKPFSLWSAIINICCVITFVEVSSTATPTLNAISSYADSNLRNLEKVK
jgi:hypothetical protein